MGDRAYVQLRDALFAGRFEPGGNLPLRTLAENFGTSITPVRDAVSRLIAQGVLELGPRNSARVPELGSDQLSQLTIVRCELEGLAAQEAVKASAPGVADALAGTLAQMRDLIRAGDFSRYLGVHRAFHFEIYAAAGVPLLQEMIENLWLRCGPVLSFVVPEYVTSLKGTDHHTAVVDAFRRGDGATARAEIVADIREASAFLLSLTDDTGTIRRRRAAEPPVEVPPFGDLAREDLPGA